jgi:16S rRNA A1518/A1519 N6-dimethyltransferase RsmA/KsgA/DIM1 with predicted DNA glycosylase/AP lyase activity
VKPVAGKRELGQHFLVDENIVGVAGRMAALGHDDVVLEVGPGLGVLTTFLADRARSSLPCGRLSKVARTSVS